MSQIGAAINIQKKLLSGAGLVSAAGAAASVAILEFGLRWMMGIMLETNMAAY